MCMYDFTLFFLNHIWYISGIFIKIKRLVKCLISKIFHYINSLFFSFSKFSFNISNFQSSSMSWIVTLDQSIRINFTVHGWEVFYSISELQCNLSHADGRLYPFRSDIEVYVSTIRSGIRICLQSELEVLN